MSGDGTRGGLYADTVAVLEGWQAPDDGQDALREDYLAYLAGHPDGLWKPCGAGHITAGVLVVDPPRERALLTLHAKAGQWFQLGGHLEPTDADVVAAATREAREESGICGLTLDPEPVHLDEHPVPFCGDETHHLDVRFVAVADPRADHRVSEESTELRWWDTEDLPGDDLAELVDLGRHRVLGV